MNSVPHFKLPLEVDSGGSFSTTEQDLLPEIAQCVRVLLATEVGERVEVPGFGAPPMLFRTEIPHDMVIRHIEEWEPRASALVSDEIDLLDPLIRHVRVQVAREGNE